MEQTLVRDTVERDMDLHAAIEDLLWRMDVVRSSQPNLEIAVSGGQATVRGIVPSEIMRAQLTQALKNLPGLDSLVLDLWSDDALEHAAALALATDPRTRHIPLGYRLVSRDGHVQVAARLSPEDAAAAVDVIRGVQGVRAVSVG